MCPACNPNVIHGLNAKEKAFDAHKMWGVERAKSLYIVACHLPRAPSYGGVRTWVEGSQMREGRALAGASNLLASADGAKGV